MPKRPPRQVVRVPVPATPPPRSPHAEVVRSPRTRRASGAAAFGPNIGGTMNTMLCQHDVGWKVTRGAGGAGARPAALPGPHPRPGDRTMSSLTGNPLAGRPLVAGPGRGGLGAHLLAGAVALAFCSGLCGLAVSPAFEVAVPRWFI